MAAPTRHCFLIASIDAEALSGDIPGEGHVRFMAGRRTVRGGLFRRRRLRLYRECADEQHRSEGSHDSDSDHIHCRTSW